MVQGSIIVVGFLVFAVLMYKQKISTFLALIGMALFIALVGGVPLEGKKGILESVLYDGSTMLASSMIAVVFGAWLGEIMNETGITKDIIRRAAELGGDRPVILAIVMAAAVAVLFTALTGLGAVIMTGTLILPILSAAGIRPAIAGSIFLFSRVAGMVLNLATWQLYINITKLTVGDLKPFAMVVAGMTAIGVLAFILLELRTGRVAWSLESTKTTPPLSAIPRVNAFALLTPIIPFPLVIFLNWPIVPAILAGCLYGVLTTQPANTFRILTKTIHEGLKSGAPAIILMIAIGMVLKAVSAPGVANHLLGVMKPIVPTGALSYFLFFCLLAPLALYRGPLNVYGLGSGIIGLLISVHTIPATAIAAGFLAAMVIQLAGDPTNTHNVWASDFLGLEVNDITRISILYLWAVTAACVGVASFMFF